MLLFAETYLQKSIILNVGTVELGKKEQFCHNCSLMPDVPYHNHPISNW